MNNFKFKYLKYKTKYTQLKTSSDDIIICPYCNKLNIKTNNYCYVCKKSLHLKKKINENNLISQNNSLTCWITSVIIMLEYTDFKLKENIEDFIHTTFKKLKTDEYFDKCPTVPNFIDNNIEINKTNENLFIKNIFKLSGNIIHDVFYEIDEFILLIKNNEDYKNVNCFFFDFFKYYNDTYMDKKILEPSLLTDNKIRSTIIESEIERVAYLNQEMGQLRKKQFDYLEYLVNFNKLENQRQIKVIHLIISKFISKNLIIKYFFNNLTFNGGLIKIISPLNKKTYSICIIQSHTNILYCNPWNNNCIDFKHFFEDINLNKYFPKFYIETISLYIKSQSQ